MRGAVARLSLLALVFGSLYSQATAAGFTVEGVVRDQDRAPMAGVTVWISTLEAIRVTETNAEGRFSFPEQPAGQAYIIAYREGMALGGANAAVLDNVSIEIPMKPGIETPLRTVDPRLRPIAGARLARMRINDRFDVLAARLADAGLPSVRSDAEGRFVIPFLGAGDIARVEIDHRNFAKEVLPTLPAGTAVDAVLPFGEPVRGRVVTPAGDPAAGAEVIVLRMSGRPSPVGDGFTDADGFYSIVVPPGDYHVTARFSTYGMPAPVPIAVAYDEETVAPDVQLLPTALISGATLNEDNEPVQGVFVRYIQRQMVLATAMSDSTGRYRLHANLGEGVLRFTPPHGHAILDESEIGLSIENELPTLLPTIRIAALPVIQGVVRVDGTEPLDRVLVSTTNLTHNVYAHPDADGNFQIALHEFPLGGKLSVRAEHAYRFLRGEATFGVFDDAEPEVLLLPFQPNLGPAAENHPNNLRARVDKPAPELDCIHWVNAESPVRLADLKGSVVVLTLWASFDQSAQATSRMRELQQWHQIYADGSVAFVGVHEGTTAPEQLEGVVRAWGIDFPVGLDTMEFETFDRYSTNVVPQTVLIDKQGVVRYYDVAGRLGELIKDLRRR